MLAALVATLLVREVAASRPVPVAAPAPTDTVLSLCDCAFEEYGGCATERRVPRRTKKPAPVSSSRLLLTLFPLPRSALARRNLNEPQDGLACKRDGFFVAGFETPGQYAQTHGSFIPLSRAICCRPCLAPGTTSLPGVGNVSAFESVIASNCQASKRAGKSSDSSIKGLSCPADSFLQGFLHDVRANPQSPSQYYYPFDLGQCCSPRVLLANGAELPVERCQCTRNSAAYAVGCGAANTPDSAAASGGLIFAFENSLAAASPSGEPVDVPVSPVRCCKACISPNAKPSMDDCSALDFCRGNGDCTADGHCVCRDGWGGVDCGDVDGDARALRATMVNAALVACALVFGCLVGTGRFVRCLGLARDRRPTALEELLIQGESGEERDGNEFDFEADDLSTSDESERDGGGDDDDDDGYDDDDGDGGGAGDGGDGAVEEGDASEPATESDATKPSGAGDERKGAAIDAHGGADPRSQDAMECTVCMSARVQTVLIPCGHACLCRKCARRIRRCPCCRTVVERRQKLYLGA